MKRILCAILCASLCFVFASCSDNGSSSENNSTSANTTQASKAYSTTENTPQTDGNYDLSFSDRDCDSSYDKNSCKITFSNSTAKTDSENGITVNRNNRYNNDRRKLQLRRRHNERGRNERSKW